MALNGSTLALHGGTLSSSGSTFGFSCSTLCSNGSTFGSGGHFILFLSEQKITAFEARRIAILSQMYCKGATSIWSEMMPENMQ